MSQEYSFCCFIRFEIKIVQSQFSNKVSASRRILNFTMIHLVRNKSNNDNPMNQLKLELMMLMQSTEKRVGTSVR